MLHDQVATAAIGTFFALFYGSFFNVVVYRIPKIAKGEDITLSRPGSSCPACHSPIRWHDNIPVLSWVFLRGHCRQCGASISLRYPMIEAGFGVCGLMISILAHSIWPVVVGTPLIIALIAIALYWRTGQAAFPLGRDKNRV